VHYSSVAMFSLIFKIRNLITVSIKGEKSCHVYGSDKKADFCFGYTKIWLWCLHIIIQTLL